MQSSLAHPWSWPWVRPWTFTAHASPSEAMSCPASLAFSRTVCGADQARCAVPGRSFRLSSLPLRWPQGQLAHAVCPSTAKTLTISQCISPSREHIMNAKEKHSGRIRQLGRLHTHRGGQLGSDHISQYNKLNYRAGAWTMLELTFTF